MLEPEIEVGRGGIAEPGAPGSMRLCGGRETSPGYTGSIPGGMNRVPPWPRRLGAANRAP
jgi:hypothetical protein